MLRKANRCRITGPVLFFLLTLLFPLGGLYALTAQKTAGDWLLHTDEVLLSIERLRAELPQPEGKTAHQLRDHALPRWSGELQRLRELTRDNPAQSERLDRLDQHIHRLQAGGGGQGGGGQGGGGQGGGGQGGGGQGDGGRGAGAQGESEAIDRIHQVLGELENEEVRLGYRRQHQRETRFDHALALFSGTAVTFVLVAAEAGWVRTESEERRKHLTERTALLGQIDNQRLKLQELIDQTPAPIAVLEAPDLRYSVWNPAYAALVGDRELKGRPVREVFPELEQSRILEPILETYRTGEARTATEELVRVPIGSADGETHYFRTCFQPTRDRTGTVVGVVLVSIEVTEQVAARKRLESSLRFYEQFIGILGHDLRNPLNAIVMAATLLRAKSNCDQTTLDRVFRSSARITRMIDQILDLARSRLAGGIPLKRAPTNLSELATKVIDDLRSTHPDRQIEWVPALAPTGQWDADRVAQVVSTLVGNALAHADPKRPIRVSLAKAPKAIELSVDSFGPLITSDLLPVIFDPDRRAARTQHSSGLGVGLFICQQIANAHGGSIRATSSEGEGTRFTLSLPVATEEPDRSVA